MLDFELDALNLRPKCESICSKGFGALQITGLLLPDNGFDPLGKIQASLKRRWREQYGVNVTGIFLYDTEKSVVSCSFCLDYGYQIHNQLDLKEYEQKFEANFDNMMLSLEKAIDEFMVDFNNGWIPYLRHIKENGGIANHNYCNDMFNRFLWSHGLKTEADERRKLERKMLIQDLSEKSKFDPDKSWDND